MIHACYVLNKEATRRGNQKQNSDAAGAVPDYDGCDTAARRLPAGDDRRLREGLTLYFLCGLESQKAKNLALDDRISLTIDHETCSSP